jgi:hypothetical protein
VQAAQVNFQAALEVAVRQVIFQNLTILVLWLQIGHLVWPVWVAAAAPAGLIKPEAASVDPAAVAIIFLQVLDKLLDYMVILHKEITAAVLLAAVVVLEQLV